jgi:hypothetical protein
MDFASDYAVQRVAARTREEKALRSRSRASPGASNATGATRRPRRWRSPPASTAATRGTSASRSAPRAIRCSQQARYRQGVEAQRMAGEAAAASVRAHMRRDGLLAESVLYDPVTCAVPGGEIEKGAAHPAQRELDAVRSDHRADEGVLVKRCATRILMAH